MERGVRVKWTGEFTELWCIDENWLYLYMIIVNETLVSCLAMLTTMFKDRCYDPKTVFMCIEHIGTIFS